MNRAMKILSAICLLAFCVAFVSVSLVRAQSTMEGKLSGTITDDKGEPLPGVTVEVTSLSMMGKRSTITTAKGTYVFLQLPPGKFKLTTSMPNFKTHVQENITIEAGSSMVLNVAMEIGAIEETVTVTAAGPIVDAKSSTLDSRIDTEMLAKLPTSRDPFYDLFLTAAGMFDAAGSGSWLPSPTAYGSTAVENIFMVNGVNTTSPRGPSWGSLVNVNYNAVEEVRIVALGSKAEYGSYSGAAIDVLTKSGSNSFHGNAAYYAQPTSWFTPNYPYPIEEGRVYLEGDQDWLYYQQGDKLFDDTESNWELSFTVGGPILRDKIWFYGAYDYRKNVGKGQNWDLLLHSWANYADLKISAEPFKNNRAWLSYHYESNKGDGWSWGEQPQWDTTMTYGQAVKNNTLSAQWQWLPSSKMILTAKYLGFSTDENPFVPDDAPDHPGYINWWKWGLQWGINGAFPYVESNKSSRNTIQADMSYYAENFLGEHDIKFGAQFTSGRGDWLGGYFQNYVNFLYPLPWGFYGVSQISIDSLKGRTWYYNNAMADGLLFYNNNWTLNPFLTVRTADSLGFFFDDQWSVTNRLTLNLGLRYDRMTTKYGVGKVYEFVTSPEEINGPPPVVRDRASSDNVFDFKTWSPRIGVTYQLTGDGKTVVRASYGRFYMPVMTETLRRFGPDMPMMIQDYQIYVVPWEFVDLNGDGWINIDWYSWNGQLVNETQNAARQVYGRDPIYSSISPRDNSWALNADPNLKDSYTDQFSFNIERELVKDFSVGATYIYKNRGDIFANVPIDPDTGQEWEYERIPYTTSYGQTVQLYSVVMKDYNHDGLVNGDDVAYVHAGSLNAFEVKNLPAYDGVKPKRVYQAIQLVFNKRYSNRWQGLFSMVYSWSEGFASRTMRQSDNMEGPMITDDAWMGNLNYTLNNFDLPLPYVPKWEFKASGSYTIPKIEADFGLRFRAHTGRPVWRYEGYPTKETWNVNPVGALVPYGAARIIRNETTWLPSNITLDLRLEKMFKIKNYGSLGIIFDVFNVFNTADVTDANLESSWGHITGITAARTFRFSFIYQY